jgi:hypothetical protein
VRSLLPPLQHLPHRSHLRASRKAPATAGCWQAPTTAGTRGGSSSRGGSSRGRACTWSMRLRSAWPMVPVPPS